MLSKEDFVKYVKSYQDMEEEQNRLMDAVPYLNVWESFPKLAYFCEDYIKLLSLLMGQEIDTEDGNDIEFFIYNLGEFFINERPVRTLEELYDQITKEG